MAREIVFDVETTGRSPEDGHRIIQIGALELVDLVPTGREFMRLVNPGRPIDPDAIAVHGITDEALRGQPEFAAIVDDLLAFFGDSPLIAHNAEFDRGFLNAELTRIGRPPFPAARFIDTLAMARRRFPGQRNSLDHLCRRFGIDLSRREKHDALLDCRLLAEVYLELKGGRQTGLDLLHRSPGERAQDAGSCEGPRKNPRAPRPHAPSAEELARHEAFLREALTNPLWLAGAGD